MFRIGDIDWFTLIKTGFLDDVIAVNSPGRFLLIVCDSDARVIILNRLRPLNIDFQPIGEGGAGKTCEFTLLSGIERVSLHAD